MANILILLVGTGGAIGLIGGIMSIVTYFSPTSRSIRKSDANIKEVQSFKDTIDLLWASKERAEKSEKAMQKKIQELEKNVALLLEKNGFSESLIKRYKLIVSYVDSCTHNKENTNNCPVAIKLRELEMEK